MAAGISGRHGVTIGNTDAARLVETEHHSFFKMARDNNEELVYALSTLSGGFLERQRSGTASAPVRQRQRK